MPLPKPKLPAGWRRAKLIALINELYLSFRGCGTCGVVVNALALSTNPQAGPLRYSLAFHLRRSKKPNSEPKLRPPAVSKSLTRSIRPGNVGEEVTTRSFIFRDVTLSAWSDPSHHCDQHTERHQHRAGSTALPLGSNPRRFMLFRFPPDARWNSDRNTVEFGIGVGEYEGGLR